MILNERKHIIVGLAIAVFVMGVGLVAFRFVQQKPRAMPGGSVSIELDGVDEQFLNQIQEVPSPQSADPAFGGSGIQQSPQYDVETWRTILEGDL